MGSGASSIGSELEDRSLDDNYRTLLLGLKDGENNKDLVALKEAFVRKEMKLKAVTVALKEALVRKEMKLNTVTGNLTSDATVDFDRVYVNEAKEIDPEVTSAQNNIKAVATKALSHVDFNSVNKVDTHIHHSAAMSPNQLLAFIISKLREFPNEVVLKNNGADVTLKQVFDSLGVTVDTIDMDILGESEDTFNRFDKFNELFQPMKNPTLKEIFLKTDNLLKGRYVAELTRLMIKSLEDSKSLRAEWRITVQGKTRNDWKKLAKWFYEYKLQSENVRWLIQTPRVYEELKTGNVVDSFGTMINNFFAPLFEITLNPDSDPALVYLLEHVVGFDSVDDESRPERDVLEASLPTPDHWTEAVNPPYGYWMYYFYANVTVLNTLRASRGLSTFEFRPHCGESGSTDHLVSAFLCAHKINHGIQLDKVPGLCYLYYLDQVGIAVSPISNAKLFLEYQKNPFPIFFAKGLNVSLSTDDPAIFHATDSPLLEEYAMARHLWKLSATDLCELARNSVIQSGWDLRTKREWLGANLKDPNFTNIPAIRYVFREDKLRHELARLGLASEGSP
eukprot:gene5200-6632_t